MQLQIRPIDQWPGETTKLRVASKFKSAWSRTLDILERELGHLKSQAVICCLDVDQSQISLGGTLKQNQRPRSPRVILVIERKDGSTLRYPCDRYHNWQDNVRAIALALEALRAVDRYGVTRRGEQYRGWEALPAPGISSKGEALFFIDKLTGRSIRPETPRSVADEIIRDAEKKTHPDRGGNAADFDKVQQARKLILG